MRLLRSSISLALIVALGYSQCTGGLYAIPAALASGSEVQRVVVSDGEPIMSSEIIACFDDLMSHALEEDHQEDDHIEQNHESDCGDGAPCVRQTQQQLTVTQSYSFAESDGMLAIPKDMYAVEGIASATETLPRARAGPLYAFAKEATHVLVKKE